MTGASIDRFVGEKKRELPSYGFYFLTQSLK